MRNVQYLLKHGAKTNVKVPQMFDLDAIDACLFRSKVKVLFVFLKLKIVSKEDLQRRSDSIKAKHNIEIFNPEIIKSLDEFMDVYNRRIALVQAKKL